MSYPHTIQAGLESLREIDQLLRQFSHDGYIPPLDLDLILQKTRNLYEVLLMLRQYQSNPPEPVVAVTGKMPEEMSMPEIQPVEKPEVKKPLSEPSVIQAAEAPGNGNSSARQESDRNEKKFLSERFSGRPSVYDSIHDTVVQKNGVPLGQVKPVSTILAAIGINERYTFIRELFNNDSTAFERAIRTIDEAPDFNSAYNYLTDQFDWDMGSEAVQVLLDIIRRKHIRARNE